jgi:hypothetical protein
MNEETTAIVDNDWIRTTRRVHVRPRSEELAPLVPGRRGRGAKVLDVRADWEWHSGMFEEESRWERSPQVLLQLADLKKDGSLGTPYDMRTHELDAYGWTPEVAALVEQSRPPVRVRYEVTE